MAEGQSAGRNVVESSLGRTVLLKQKPKKAIQLAGILLHLLVVCLWRPKFVNHENCLGAMPKLRFPQRASRCGQELVG
jgi:hypothetical protein